MVETFNVVTENICVDCALKKGLKIPADPYAQVVFIDGKIYWSGQKIQDVCSFCGKIVKNYYTRTLKKEV